MRRKQARGANASSGAQRRATKWATIGALLLLAGLITLFVIGDQVPGLRTLLEGGSFKDLRWEIMPVLGQMMAEFAVFGSGFGSFEEVYHIFEPDGLLQPDYINQAHNDWAQIVIEGGALAVLLVALLLAWLAKSLLHLINHKDSRGGSTLFWGTIFVMIMLASLADYPLRTPLFQGVGVLLLVAFAKSQRHRDVQG